MEMISAKLKKMIIYVERVEENKWRGGHGKVHLYLLPFFSSICEGKTDTFVLFLFTSVYLKSFVIIF